VKVGTFAPRRVRSTQGHDDDREAPRDPVVVTADSLRENREGREARIGDLSSCCEFERLKIL